jgi:hypothetical protein
LKITHSLTFSRGDIVKRYYFILIITGGGGHRSVGAVKVPRQCPIALEVKIGCKQGKALRSEEDSV